MRRTVLLVVVPAVLAVLAVVAVVTTALRRPERVVKFGNQVRVELLGTAIGGATFTTEKQWERLARKALPARWTGWIRPATTGNCGSGTNGITVFVRVTNPLINSPPWAGYMTEDEDSFRFPRDGGYCSFSSGTNSVVYGLTLRAYPRRQPSFLLHFLGTHGAVVASLRVPNPMSGPFPIWRPGRLPQTQTNGPVVLTLVGLQDSGGMKSPSVKPLWELNATDPAWIEARALYTTFSDATGNEGQALSRSEPAWKLETLVYRERLEDFAESERLVLTNLAIPKPGSLVEIDQTAERGGSRLRIHVLAGAGRLLITNGVQRGMLPPAGADEGHSTSSSGTSKLESWGSSTPFFLVEAWNLQSSDEIRFRLFDDLKREIKFDRSDGYYNLANGSRMYRRRFHPPEDAHSVSLELIVNRPLRFEFMVNPTDVRPAQP
jgi:hypothetical protein